MPSLFGETAFFVASQRTIVCIARACVSRETEKHPAHPAYPTRKIFYFRCGMSGIGGIKSGYDKYTRIRAKTVLFFITTLLLKITTLLFFATTLLFFVMTVLIFDTTVLIFFVDKGVNKSIFHQ